MSRPWPVTSSAREQNHAAGPEVGLAISFLTKAELPKHSSGVSVHWLELEDHGWLKKEG